jgi:hypothetical protein
MNNVHFSSRWIFAALAIAVATGVVGALVHSAFGWEYGVVRSAILGVGIGVWWLLWKTTAAGRQ